MSLGLLLPGALVSLVALLLPLLIHLARRNQQQPLDFAALRWLNRKPKPRRRLRVDDIPLLLLRLLLLALLALWLAQPVRYGASERRTVVAVMPGIDTATVAQQRLPADARKQWLADHLQLNGRLVLDAGAVKALGEGKSLLPIGVVEVLGDFERGAVVACLSPEGQEVARGLINYGSSDARRIARHGSQEIEKTLGYIDEPEMIHRDNLVIC